MYVNAIYGMCEQPGDETISKTRNGDDLPALSVDGAFVRRSEDESSLDPDWWEPDWLIPMDNAPMANDLAKPSE